MLGMGTKIMAIDAYTAISPRLVYSDYIENELLDVKWE